MKAIVAGRDPHAGTDAILDATLEKAFCPNLTAPPEEAADIARLARNFALEHGWANAAIRSPQMASVHSGHTRRPG